MPSTRSGGVAKRSRPFDTHYLHAGTRQQLRDRLDALQTAYDTTHSALREERRRTACLVALLRKRGVVVTPLNCPPTRRESDSEEKRRLFYRDWYALRAAVSTVVLNGLSVHYDADDEHEREREQPAPLALVEEHQGGVRPPLPD